MADARGGYLPDQESNWQPDVRRRPTLPQPGPPRSIDEDLSTDPSRPIPDHLRPHGRASIIVQRLPPSPDLDQSVRFAVSPRAEWFVSNGVGRRAQDHKMAQPAFVRLEIAEQKLPGARFNHDDPGLATKKRAPNQLRTIGGPALLACDQEVQQVSHLHRVYRTFKTFGHERLAGTLHRQDLGPENRLTSPIAPR